ncbi:hypothetical protein [Streptomyces hypolithicus]
MRSYLSAVLIVLVAVLVPMSAVAVWADREIGDTGRYVAAMAPLAEDPAVQNAVARRVTDEVTQEIDLGPLQEGATQLIGEAVVSFTGTDAFQQTWNTVNRATHAAFKDALNDGSGNKVTLDLAPVAEEVKQQLVADGVPFADQIPVEPTEVTVLESDRLGTWREIYRLLQLGGFWLPVATLVAAVGAILLALRRLGALAWLGVAVAVGAVLLLITVVAGRGITLDDLPPDLDRAAAGAVYDALTSPLRTAAWVVLAAGAVLAVGAWLTGRLRRRGTLERQPAGVRPV